MTSSLWIARKKNDDSFILRIPSISVDYGKKSCHEGLRPGGTSGGHPVDVERKLWLVVLLPEIQNFTPFRTLRLIFRRFQTDNTDQGNGASSFPFGPALFLARHFVSLCLPQTAIITQRDNVPARRSDPHPLLNPFSCPSSVPTVVDQVNWSRSENPCHYAATSQNC